MFSFSKPDDWHHLPLYTKISHYKLQLNEQYAQYVNKLEAKLIVKNILEDKIHIAKVIRVLKDCNDFTKEDININHVLKTVHGSGWNIIDLNTTTISKILSSLKKWNRIFDGVDEPHYKHIKPQFFIEEKLKDKFGGNDLSTFMFRCIHGKPQTFSIKKNGLINNFDIKRKPIKHLEHDFHIGNDLFLKMKSNAEILCKPFEFVRIDFFIDNMDHIYFSEFTFTPLSGWKYYPDDIEFKLGRLWT